MESNLPGWATALLAAAGVAVFAIAAWLLLQGVGEDEAVPAPPVVTSTPTDPEPSPTATATATPPAGPVTAQPTSTPTGGTEEVPVPEGDPVALAQRYIAAAKSVNYAEPPGAWLDEADYVTDNLRAHQIELRDAAGGEWDEQTIADRTIIRPTQVTGVLEPSDDPQVAFVLVEFRTEMFTDGASTPVVGTPTATLVTLVGVEGRWMVDAEAFPH